MARQRPSAQPVQRVFPNQAEELIRKGDALVIDVRPAADYAAGHIPGARSLPLATLATTLSALPGQTIIFYCT